MGRKRATEALEGLDELFSLDEPEEESEKKESTGNTTSVAVHMDIQTRDAFQQIADKHSDMSRSAAMRYALRWFLSEYRVGHVDLEFTEMRRLQFPD